MTVADILKQMREDSGLSVRSFSKKLGISPRMYSAIVKGTRQPGGRTLTAIFAFMRSHKKNPEVISALWDYIDERGAALAAKGR